MQMVQRLLRLVAMSALLLGAFAAGSAFAVLGTEHVLPLARAAAALRERLRLDGLGRFETTLWASAPDRRTGTTIARPGRAADGLTLLTSGAAQRARLIAVDGGVVHEWHLPFSQVWPTAAHVRHVPSDDFIHWPAVHLYPNGDLLAVYVSEYTSPHGLGLARMDRDSKLIWRYSGHAHHAVDVGPDGRIYTLTETIEARRLPGIPLHPPFLHDQLVVLSPAGEVLKEVSILEAFRQSDYRDALRLLPQALRGDVTRTNEVQVISAEIAALHPFLSAGQVLISVPRINTVAVLDPERGTIVWALRGPWQFPHDPDFLPNGNMLIFDSRGHLGAGGRSRVVEFDPRTLATVWSYAGDADQPLDSPIRSGQQRLANGNTLIWESDRGRLLEVTPAHEIVWEYRNPERGGANGELVAIVGAVRRIDPAALEFLDPDLISGAPPAPERAG